MERKTQPVYDLVKEVLLTIPKPWSKHITNEVFLKIESNKKWTKQYEYLSSSLRTWVVNNWIGKYTCEIAGRESGKQLPATSKLIKSYKELLAKK